MEAQVQVQLNYPNFLILLMAFLKNCEILMVGPQSSKPLKLKSD